MCGLAGTARIGGGELLPEADELLARMSAAVAHRGPDGERILREGPVGLAFRRLALVATHAGEQPLSNPDGSVVLIANGEVYNHRELEATLPAGTRMRTGSDCEVLVSLYERDGLRFLDRVAGMYAIVLWDRARNRLLFARDRFGIKPLYYTRNGDGLSFASEIKALFEDPRCPRAIDWEAALADEALTAAPFLVTDPVTSWFRGVEVVPAGTIVSFDLATGRSETHTYWRLPDFAGGGDASDEEFVRRYRELLAASVEDCASAEAEVGLFLSGGIDSSAVAALAAGHRRLHTFTALNGSTLTNGDAEYAHRTAAAVGLPNHQLVFDADRVPEVDEWKRLLWLLETPLCGPEQYYKFDLYRYVKAVRPELKGMLLGQASDEFNGGYSTSLSGETDWDTFMAVIGRLRRARALHDSAGLAPWWVYHRRPLLREEVLVRRADPPLPSDPYTAFVHWKYRGIQQYNNWHEDRTAAGNGVEARVPFLDHRIVELLATVPVSRRAALLWDKRILRAAVADILPQATQEREKVSFYHGDAAQFTHRTFVRMLAQDGCALLEEALAAPTAGDLLDADAVRDMLLALSGSRAPGGVEFLLRLTNLGLLEGMLARLPAVPSRAARRNIPPAAHITDWDADAPALAASMGYERARVAPSDVVGLAEGVLLVHAPSDPQVYYVAVDGQFEYVVDEREDAAWCRFLRALDGRRPVAAVLDETGAALDDVADVLHEAVDAGVVVVRTEPAAEHAERAAGQAERAAGPSEAAAEPAAARAERSTETVGS